MDLFLWFAFFGIQYVNGNMGQEEGQMSSGHETVAPVVPRSADDLL